MDTGFSARRPSSHPWKSTARLALSPPEPRLSLRFGPDPGRSLLWSPGWRWDSGAINYTAFGIVLVIASLPVWHLTQQAALAGFGDAEQARQLTNQQHRCVAYASQPAAGLLQIEGPEAEAV